MDINIRMAEYNVMTKDVFNYMMESFLSIDERNVLRLLNTEYRDKYKGKININTLIRNNNLKTLKYLIIMKMDYTSIITNMNKMTLLNNWDMFNWMCSLRNTDENKIHKIMTGGMESHRKFKLQVVEILLQNLHLFPLLDKNIDLSFTLEDNKIIEESYFITWITYLVNGDDGEYSIGGIKSPTRYIRNLVRYGCINSLNFIYNVFHILLKIGLMDKCCYMYTALKHNNLSMVQWLCEKGHIIRPTDLNRIRNKVNKDIVDYVERNQKKECYPYWMV
ncbi:Ankyrin-repeat protein [Orpheovirus IHUMI-LCC2]|uniref:Ankyrin-repeat protein n=1 Tax=Orpheovirus IHUMI-LCC2 TaxID=2023057 RepID=A0A2I2L452_9VIRU|nr:Ankyrin-repeat protein [Orpheovirus IHUMI-LCC2]SNW62291.1 Ankyrin-repeat protein [Orpheovirus IHUMI-LCC2]